MGPQWHQVIAASRRSHWVSLANSSDPNHTWWDTSGLLVKGFPGKVDGWRMIGDDSQSKQNILESLNMFSIVQHICRLRWMPRIQHLKHNWRVAMYALMQQQDYQNEPWLWSQDPNYWASDSSTRAKFSVFPYKLISQNPISTCHSEESLKTQWNHIPAGQKHSSIVLCPMKWLVWSPARER